MRRPPPTDMEFREITAADVPALLEVRVATHENALSREELSGLGITEDSVREKLRTTFRGWLCEADRKVVGFVIGDRSTGEIWVIAVLPDYLGQGVGSRLLTTVESWLRENGCRRLWLTTDVDTTLRAYAFYRSHGWEDDRIENGMRYMVRTLR